MDDVLVAEEAERAITQAHFIVVADKTGYDVAEAYVKTLTDMEKRVKAYFKPMKQELDQAKKTVLGKEKEMLSPISEEKDLLKSKMSTWYRGEMAKRKAEEEKMKVEAEQQGFDPELVKDVVSAGKPDVSGQRVKYVWEVGDVDAFGLWAKNELEAQIRNKYGLMWEALEKIVDRDVRTNKTATRLPIVVKESWITAVR